jgi:hypothetical protein
MGVAYSDAPSPRWDRIAGVVVWLALGLALIDPLDPFFIADCISEECTPSLGWRILALLLSAFSISAVGGWIAAALLKRAVYRRSG